ncbi:hypothetical protein [Desulfovibrio ferrophilus]|uniref:Cell division protein FtsK/SpoIIIE n=1 Tax=Desulfovibrio ferrophilus TaxID=241368 RepID=A0A2Z6B2M9_9BACT|nr:hypothetical protein [Desulfovibrio ferrophilus]BBD09713.1 cell division protein FtsK/SpoIIIE [Desulfovibrio ferrophilus]
MKPYSILLAVLWLTTSFTDLWSLAYASHPLFVLKSIGTVVLFTLCLMGCLQLAWGRIFIRFAPGQWRMTYQGTLTMGAFYVLLKNFGDVLGVATMAGDTSIFQIGLDFLPYLLFAIPIIVLEHELNKEQ